MLNWIKFYMSSKILLVSRNFLVIIAMLHVLVETKPAKVNLNGNVTTVHRSKRAAEKFEYFKSVPEYTQLSDDFNQFEWLRDHFRHDCNTKTETLPDDAFTPKWIKHAVPSGQTGRCSPVKITYQLVHKTGEKKAGKPIYELIHKQVIVAYRKA
eukprot:Seg954.1 transcript_id=Seg954.1/GoldUCD/mRNA.D3Y31 product="hypothetical protein" protein_id=Seg954.1/GoldUCD/D3Y31